MPQFAVYRNASPGSREEFPFLLDVQTDLLDDLESRVVIPLARAKEFTEFPAQYLVPIVVFLGKHYAVLTPQLAGVPRNELGPQMGNLAEQARCISTAIEFLLKGFA